MPTYEYECTSCGQHIEVFQRIAEDPLTTCGACGGKLRKVFHPAGIVFKGSGFYATDSRSSQKTEATQKDAKKGADSGSAAPPSSTGSSGSSESSGSSGSDSGSKSSAPKESSAT